MKPDYPLHDPRFPYVPADRTDISRRFRAVGYKTIEEMEAAELLEYALRAVRNFRNCHVKASYLS